jgi:hypothetical protein
MESQLNKVDMNQKETIISVAERKGNGRICSLASNVTHGRWLH